MSKIAMFRQGLVQWRRAAVQRRGAAPVFVALAAQPQPAAGGRRGPAPTPTAPAVHRPSIQIGEFVISPEGDPRLLGHPQIRY